MFKLNALGGRQKKTGIGHPLLPWVSTTATAHIARLSILEKGIGKKYKRRTCVGQELNLGLIDKAMWPNEGVSPEGFGVQVGVTKEHCLATRWLPMRFDH